MPDKLDTLLALLRWAHILAGIIWIGHLYFFNFVNGPFAKTMDADTKKKVVPELMPRALWWFRWGAMMTFGFGLLLFVMKYFYISGVGLGPNEYFLKGGHMTQRAMWILFGMLLGTVMWFNVWFVIWPRQRKLIGWLKAGEKNPAADALTRQAFVASRANTYLSGPMLFGMIAAANFPYMTPVTFGIGVALGLGVMHLLIGQSGKVSTEV